MTISNNIYFTYDGVDCRDMGVINVTFTGMVSEPFLATSNINESFTRNNSMPYFQNIKRQPLVLDLVLAFKSKLDPETVRNVRKWLGQERMKELYFHNQPYKKYNAICQGLSTLTHIGNMGYISISFLTDSPYAHSDYIETRVYEITTVPTLVFARNSLAVHPETGSIVSIDEPIFINLGGT